jgi:hypothetical protein
MVGEFELTVDGNENEHQVDSTSVITDAGPFANTRFAAVPGVNFTQPSSGSFVLTNLVPSTLDPFSSGYRVSAQMFMRTNRGIEYFRSPARGNGLNSPLVVTSAVGPVFCQVANRGFCGLNTRDDL